MHKIIHKQIIAQDIKRIDIAAAGIVSRISPGQFVMVTPILGVHAVALTVVDVDDRKDSLSFIVHEIGSATRVLGNLPIGGVVEKIVGPLGRPAVIDKYGLVICVATGIGAAQILPICRALKKKGNKVIGIIGAKSKKVLMLESQMRVVCDDLFITTNDGSYERKGLATSVLGELLNKYKVNAIYAIGSVDMMQAAAGMAAKKEIPIRVTLNPYMTNGLGICGSCRVVAGGRFQLACTDGPEFDGHTVDFNDLIKRDQACLSGRQANKEKVWDRQSRPSSPRTEGLPTFMKSFWGMVKKKT